MAKQNKNAVLMDLWIGANNQQNSISDRIVYWSEWARLSQPNNIDIALINIKELAKRISAWV